MPDDIVSLMSQWEHIQQLELEVQQLRNEVEGLKKVIQDLARRTPHRSTSDVLP